MDDLKANALVAVLAITFLFAVGSCIRAKNEARYLKIMNEHYKKDQADGHPDAWIEGCRHGVNMACYFADCATVSIDEMQERICRKDQIR